MISTRTRNDGGGFAPGDNAVVSDVSIQLTPPEERLFDVMISAAESYENGELNVDESQSFLKFRSKDAPPPVSEHSASTSPSEAANNRERIEIRVAGGWVRDKILGVESSDIDVALDTVSGVHFASIVQEYLLKLERDGTIPAPKKRHRICVIAANPSQFKRLETATMKIFDGELDFVHLRAAEGDNSNRAFGTPREDALLRDFTVNALFYNVRTRRVEDWTGRGADDLLGEGEGSAGGRRIIATPVDAAETFQDDPLRALRAVRFAVRLDAALSDGVRSAITTNDEVRKSLRGEGSGSVSRERVGKEIEGMLSGAGAKPGRALGVLTELNLAPLVFPLPPDVSDKSSRGDFGERAQVRRWTEAGELVRFLEEAIQYHRLEEELENESESSSGQHLSASAETRLLYLATFLSPFRELSYEFKKGKYRTAVTHMVKEGVKFKNKDESAMSTLLENVESFRSLLRSLGRQLAAIEEEPSPCEKDALLPRQETGMLLRKLKDLWPTCLVLASVLEMRAVEETDCPNVGGFKSTRHALRTSREFHRAVLRQGLDCAWQLRPLLDGRAVVSTLGLGKPGPMVQFYIEEQIKWLLLHPDGTREDCEQHLQEIKKERDGADVR